MDQEKMAAALKTAHAQQVARVALNNHADALGKTAKKNDELGYTKAAREQRNDASYIEEVIVKAFDPQTDLALDQVNELQAFFASRALKRLRRIETEIRKAITRASKPKAKDAPESDDPVEAELLRSSDWLGHEMTRVARLVAERAHHDGLTAREYSEEGTLVRVMRELVEQPFDDERVG